MGAYHDIQCPIHKIARVTRHTNAIGLRRAHVEERAGGYGDNTRNVAQCLERCFDFSQRIEPTKTEAHGSSRESAYGMVCRGSAMQAGARHDSEVFVQKESDFRRHRVADIERDNSALLRHICGSIDVDAGDLMESSNEFRNKLPPMFCHRFNSY